jgi:hypothetical protein
MLFFLGLSDKTSYSGSLGKFLKQVKENGECDIKYTVPMEIMEKINFEGEYKNIIFKTHKELDEFTHKLMKALEISNLDLSINFKDDYALLKSFDRAFWLRQ